MPISTEPIKAQPRRTSSRGGNQDTRPAGLSSNPVKSALVVRDNTAAGSSSSAQVPGRAEARAAARRRELKRRGEDWGDRMMEETLEMDVFRKAIRYIHPSLYPQITHERHLNSHCSYPTCRNPPYRPWHPGKRFVVNGTKRTITEQMDNAEEGFCGDICRKRSQWLEEELTRFWADGRRGEVRLAEDLVAVAAAAQTANQLQPDKEASSSSISQSSSTPKSAASQAPASEEDDGNEATTGSAFGDGGKARTALAPVQSPVKMLDNATTTEPNHGSSSSSTDVQQRSEPHSKDMSERHPMVPRARRPDALIKSTPQPPPEFTTDPSDILANLTIHERPTTTTTSDPPQPPSLDSAPAPLPSAGPSTRRTSGSLVSTPSKLKATFLNVHKSMGPIPQQAPESDDEDEDRHRELEWERSVGLEMAEGGEDTGGTSIWEEMRLAKEEMEKAGT